MADERTFADELTKVSREKGVALVAYARGRLHDARIPASRASAEDMVQDAIAIALANQAKEPINNLEGYLRTVIKNRVRDEKRRRRVADPIDVAEAEAKRVLWVSDIEDVDGRLDAEKALHGMSCQQRRLILLAKGVGYSHQELADLTNLNRGTISRHIARATQVLTSALGATAVAAVLWATLITAELSPPASPPGGPSYWKKIDPLTPALAAAALFAALCASGWMVNRIRSTALRRTQVLRGMLQVVDELRQAPGAAAVPPARVYAQRLGIPVGWIDEKTLIRGRLKDWSKQPIPRSTTPVVPLPVILRSGDMVQEIRPGSNSEPNQVIYGMGRHPYG
ncbi:RNA polymerase sigma factor [Streptomyces sp. NPDC091416]|uniref:RNA polymerase sigma factor n=1 Tax=Streptomyces sp. NPDC091416 TaxID=3366003 RepID=UPI0037FA0A00